MPVYKGHPTGRQGDHKRTLRHTQLQPLSTTLQSQTCPTPKELLSWPPKQSAFSRRAGHRVRVPSIFALFRSFTDGIFFRPRSPRSLKPQPHPSPLHTRPHSLRWPRLSTHPVLQRPASRFMACSTQFGNVLVSQHGPLWGHWVDQCRPIDGQG